MTRQCRIAERVRNACLLALVCGLGCTAREPVPDPPVKPSSAPQEQLEIPADLRIRLHAEGDKKIRRPVSARLLGKMKPDAARGGGSAWRIHRFFGRAYFMPRAVLWAENAEGDALVLKRPAARADGKIPMLVLNRRGDASVFLLGPEDEAAEFHGRGNRRGRGGGGALGIRDVTALRITFDPEPAPSAPEAHGAGAKAAAAANVPALKFIAAGKAPIVVEDLSDVPIHRERGDRLEWSLRDRITAKVGPGHRVTKLVSASEVVAIQVAEWSDEAALPILKLNRRRQWRFRWTDIELLPIDRPGLRGVIEIHVEAGG